MKLVKEQEPDMCLTLAACLLELPQACFDYCFKRKNGVCARARLYPCSTLNPVAACKVSNCSFSFP